MATQYIPIGGLWQRDTKRGPVLSCQVNPAIRAKLLDALNGPELLEITVFVNDRRDKPNSPTHNLVLSVQEARRGEAAGSPQEPREAPASPQGQRERDRGPVERESSFPVHPGVMGDDFVPDDDIPFAWLLPFVLPAILFGSYV